MMKPAKAKTPKNAEKPYEKVLKRLRSAGLRPTRQRMALAKLLFEGRDRHVTAEILHAEAKAASIRVAGTRCDQKGQIHATAPH